MDNCALIIAVHMLDGRYHGEGDWPPSPFRLFQALVAAAHLGRNPSEVELKTLEWLENLEAPVIAAPKAKKSSIVTYYVPNNDLDAVGGDPARIAAIRTGKQVSVRLFDERTPFLFAWVIQCNVDFLKEVKMITERLYQFGRGVDMAYADSETIELGALDQVLAMHGGCIYRPTPQGTQGTGKTLRCPKNGSYNSLTKRHAHQLSRLRDNVLSQASPPIYSQIVYDCPPSRLLFDLVTNDKKGGYYAQTPENVSRLTERIRDLAASRLDNYFGLETVKRIVNGRNTGESDKTLRIRIVPIPSIGTVNADQYIRRVLIEVPPACPIQFNDIAWALNGMDLGCDLRTGEILDDLGPLLVLSDSREMLLHYGIETAINKLSTVWRTVTPVVLPHIRACGPISGDMRLAHEKMLIHATKQALRHAGFDQKVEILRIQKEPFDINGIRAEAFSYGKRFTSSRLYHVEIAFEEAITGSVVIGDGRYLGLGLMAPQPEDAPDVVAISLKHLNRPILDNRKHFLNAVRRALMAQARDLTGAPGRLFSGHEFDGRPARSGKHDHVFLVADDVDNDGRIDRLLIIAPWRADRTRWAKRGEHSVFFRVASSLRTVRSGKLGVVEAEDASYVSSADRMFRLSKSWRSEIPYVPTRFPKRRDNEAKIVADDLILECSRRGLPKPKVEITQVTHGKNGGITVKANLIFDVAVRGPLLLGRDCHEGGGVFVPEK